MCVWGINAKKQISQVRLIFKCFNVMALDSRELVHVSSFSSAVLVDIPFREKDYFRLDPTPSRNLPFCQ